MATIKAPKKLIEVALPLDAINAAAAREKSIRHGHPSTLHLWWARRPLAAARAVIFAQMVNDPGYERHLGRGVNKKQAAAERERLFKIIEDLVQWENTGNEGVVERARAEIRRSWRETCELNKNHPRAAELFNPEKLPAFHDPFAGGGALPLEAQRLGLEAYASDLNPVAVLINKAMIEIPPRFAEKPPVNPEARQKQDLIGHDWKGARGLAEDVRYYGRWMRDEAERRIGHLYPKIEVTAEMAKDRPDLKPYVGQKLTVIAWLWARTVKSPNPAFSHVPVPLASTFVLSIKAGKEAYVEPIVEGDTYRFTVRVVSTPSFSAEGFERAKAGTKLARGANFECLMSGTPISDDYIKAESMAGRMGARLMAIVAEGPSGRIYLPPIEAHEAIARQAQPTWKPDQPMNRETRDLVSGRGYGFFTWADLFTTRQLVALTTFSDLVGEAIEKCRQDYLRANPPSPFMERGLGGEVNVTGHAFVSAEKLQLAKQMRKHPTAAEARAWELLRNRRCLGLKFRRQQVIQGFIVDFYCAEKRLAIELDGGIHESQQEYDQARDAALMQAGVRVIRIRNEDLSEERLEDILTSPPGPLSINGEGEVDHELGLDQGGTGATAYAEAVGVYLGMALSRLTDICNALCRWEVTKTQVRNLFGRQAIPMLWDYAENNVFGEAAGDYIISLENMVKVVERLPSSSDGVAKQTAAQDQSISTGKIVSTDPPYYDNIGYADLSDFFYVWLRRSLRGVYPDLFATWPFPKQKNWSPRPTATAAKRRPSSSSSTA